MIRPTLTENEAGVSPSPEPSPGPRLRTSAASRFRDSPGARIRTLWRHLSPLPGGKWLFSRLLGLMVPYSGTVGATVLQLEPGRVRVQVTERRRIRNHLGSVHAIALANVGELASGLALVGALGPEARGILTGIDVRYTKKARGTLEAEARCTVPEITETMDRTVDAEIRDADDDVVATVTAHWRLGPVRREGG